MLGKLMKHEFRATGRINLALCGIMLLLAVVAGVLLPPWTQGENATFDFQDQVGATVLIFYGLSIFAVSIGVFIALVLRYKRNLLGDEGYLMRTLPVSIHELLLSKLFTALAWIVGAAVFIALSFLLVALAAMISGAISGAEFTSFLDFLRRMLAQTDFSAWVWVVLNYLGGAAAFLLLCYAELTMLQTFSKHKGLYIAISVVAIIVVLRLVSAFNTLVIVPDVITWREEASGAVHYITRASYHGSYITPIEIFLADVGLYFLTWAFLKYKPNLE